MENEIIKHLKKYMENTSDEQFEKDIEELIKKYPYCTINNEISDENNVEQAAHNELFRSYTKFDGEFKYDSNAMINMFIKGANWKFENMWTPIEKELPPCNNDNLFLLGIDATGDENIPDVGFMHGGDDNIPRIDNFICGRVIKVTHWMPIPKKRKINLL